MSPFCLLLCTMTTSLPEKSFICGWVNGSSDVASPLQAPGSAGATHLEGQFVIGKRTFIAVLILHADGDEGKVVAIGIEGGIIVLIGTAFDHAAAVG